MRAEACHGQRRLTDPWHVSYLQRCLETNAAVLADMESEAAADRERHARFLQELAAERGQPWSVPVTGLAGHQPLGMPGQAGTG